MSLKNIPYEIVCLVVQHLSLDEVWSLSRTCRKFDFLICEENIAKNLLESKAKETAEAQSAQVSRRYASSLRRLLKRREAISTARPFLTAIVAVCDSWIYENGTLCYIHERQLRVLDLLNSASSEIVVDIRKLLDEAIPESHSSKKYKVHLLYYSHGIVSCQYSHALPHTEHWLLVFDVKQQKVLTAPHLQSTLKLFVRNNADHLFYGTHSGIGLDEFRRWVIRAYDIRKGRVATPASARDRSPVDSEGPIEDEGWLPARLQIDELAGCDVGSNVCFEIIGDYFYGLSNSTKFEIEEVDWTSSYCAFRFPLKQPTAKRTEWTSNETMWRRRHDEGPIDDRWSFMRIVADPNDMGDLKVVESRKEWLRGQSCARRTYYTTKLVFGETQGLSRTDSHAGRQKSIGGPSLAAGHAAASPPREVEQRSPMDVHPGDDNTSSLMFTFNKCFIRSYHVDSNAFLDVVDDPPSEAPNLQRIRVRVGPRRLRAPDDIQQRLAAAEREHGGKLTLDQKIEAIYEVGNEAGPVVCWPPEEDDNNPEEYLAKLNHIMNPPSHLGNLHGTWDERNFIYETGPSSDGLKALVLISFDPASYLGGVSPYYKCRARPQKQTIDEARSSSSETSSLPERPKGKGTRGRNSHSPAALGGKREVQAWARTADAMHRNIAYGFHFAM